MTRPFRKILRSDFIARIDTGTSEISRTSHKITIYYFTRFLKISLQNQGKDGSPSTFEISILTKHIFLNCQIEEMWSIIYRIFLPILPVPNRYSWQKSRHLNRLNRMFLSMNLENLASFADLMRLKSAKFPQAYSSVPNESAGTLIYFRDF